MRGPCACPGRGGLDSYSITPERIALPPGQAQGPSSTPPYPLSLMNFANLMRKCRGPVLMNINDRMGWPYSVGTRGGCVEGWGPCACPGRALIPLGFHGAQGQPS